MQINDFGHHHNGYSLPYFVIKATYEGREYIITFCTEEHNYIVSERIDPATNKQNLNSL